MTAKLNKQRFYASLLILGACILLYRTLSMVLAEQAFEILLGWVLALLVTEFLIDLAWLLTSIAWLISADSKYSRWPLRLGAAAIIFHAIRVLVYVLGRTGPWLNFDVKPEQREAYEFEWFWVYFAAILATLGVVGVVVIWQLIRRKRKKK